MIIWFAGSNPTRRSEGLVIEFEDKLKEDDFASKLERAVEDGESFIWIPKHERVMVRPESVIAYQRELG